MQKIINRILFFILICLIALLGYKTMITPDVTATEVITTISDKQTHAKSPEEFKEEVEVIVKNYLMDKPEVVISAIENWQKHKIQENQQKTEGLIKEKKAELENALNSPTIGSHDGKEIIVAFFDYNCTYCKKGDLYLRDLIDQDPNIKIILRPFPILGETSEFAAKVALGVFKIAPDKFQLIHHELMDMRHITRESVNNLLVAHGINIENLMHVMASEEISAALEHNLKLASDLRIKGAPAYIINGKMFPGLMDVTQFKDVITKTSPSKDEHHDIKAAPMNQEE